MITISARTHRDACLDGADPADTAAYEATIALFWDALRRQAQVDGITLRILEDGQAERSEHLDTTTDQDWYDQTFTFWEWYQNLPNDHEE